MWLSRITDWLKAYSERLWQVAVLALTSFLYVIAFPPFSVSEAAFVFLVPFFIWLWREPSLKSVCLVSLASGWASWIVLIFWLRHVTVFGTVALAGVVALHFVGFALGAAWLTRKLRGKSVFLAILRSLAISSLWVVIEHTRTWIFTGFPWLTLSTSQWDQPLMLQSASFLGAWGVSFAVVLMNVGIAAYLLRIVEYARKRGKAICAEFYLALVVVVYLSFLQTPKVRHQEREDLFKATVLQPAVPQNLKWDTAAAVDILKKLERNSLLLKPMKGDAIFWPESTIPYPLRGDESLVAWAERLANRMEIPIVAGALAVEEVDEGDPIWRNSVFLVRPKWGVYPKYYSKRHLVPFGEYIPLRSMWPWIQKVVPLEGDFLADDKPNLIPLNFPERTIKIGSLICFEDLFPSLARQSTLDGAAMLYVATNSAWYGRSGASAQHMAHSVLRAVENRRIVLRVGNDGWTGWIDEYGNVREAFDLFDPGGTSWQLDRDRRWVGKKTFYVRYGDWFVWLCYLVAASGFGYGAWARKAREPGI